MDNITSLYDLKLWYGMPIIKKVDVIVSLAIIFWTIKDIFLLKCPRNYIPLDLILRLLPMICWIPIAVSGNSVSNAWWSFAMCCLFCLGQMLIFNNIPMGKAIIADGFYMWMFVFLFFGMCLPHRLPVYIFFGVYALLFFFSDSQVCVKLGIPKTFFCGGVNFLASSTRHLLTFSILMISSIIMINIQTNLYKVLWSAKQEVEYAANHDYLSGLYNRNILSSIIKDDIYNKDAYFIFVDIDDFKHFNDEYGHDIGDSVILRVADKLKDVFPEKSNYIIRQGGDEFFCIVDIKVPIEDRLNKVYQELNQNHKLKIGLSIGYAKYDYGVSVEQIKKIADDALYTAKEQGKNQYVKG